jgi:hypothetical protein
VALPGEEAEGVAPEAEEPNAAREMPAWGYAVVALLFLVFALMLVAQIAPEWFGRPAATEGGNLLVRTVGAISLLAIPFVLAFFPTYAALRGLPVYEEFVEGAKEGFNVSVRIIPFLVTILSRSACFAVRAGWTCWRVTRIQQASATRAGSRRRLKRSAFRRTCYRWH